MVRMFAIAAVGIVALAVVAPQYAPRLMAAVVAATDRDDAARARGQPDADAPRVAAPASGAPSRPGPDRQVVLSADRRGHFLIEARAGRRSFTAMVDTGATSVVLTEETARRIGLRPRPGDFMYRVTTANGVIHGARVRIPSLEVGGIRLHDVEAMVIPGPMLDMNLLGMSYLSRLSSFEVRGDRLVLTR